MRRSVLFSLLLGLGIVVSAPAAGSEQRREAAIVGILFVSAGADDPVIQALRRGLRDRGYVEGRDLRIVHRSAGGQLAKLPELAEELVRLKVDVIVTGAYGSTRAAQQATQTIPIVANFYEQDPVASGFIDSFNHPSGNMTGIYTRNELLAAKRLELLKEALPRVSRVAVLFDA